jgi:hypothetical protein
MLALLTRQRSTTARVRSSYPSPEGQASTPGAPNMQTIYATHLVLPGQATEDTWQSARELAGDWVHRRIGAALGNEVSGSADSDQGSVRWALLEGESGKVLSVVADRADSGDVAWRWRTLLDLGWDKSDQVWLRVRVGLMQQVEGLLTRPRVAAGRPGLVRSIVDAFPVVVDGWRVGEWRPVHEQNVEPYLAFLRDAGRQLPVVALSEDQRRATFLDPAYLADRLLGLAHVVTVDTEAAYQVSDAVGKSLSCFLGAVRVYWPGFSPADDPYHHRLFVAGGLTFLGPDGVQQELFDMLGRLAGLSLGEPALRRRLKIEQRAAEVEARIAERLDARAHLAAAPLTPEGGVDADTWSAFTAEYDAAQAQLQDLELAGLEAEAELETLRLERDDARAQLLQVIRGLDRAEVPEIDIPPQPPSTVVGPPPTELLSGPPP